MATVCFLLIASLFLPLGLDLPLVFTIEGIILAIFLFNQNRARFLENKSLVTFLLIATLNASLSLIFHAEYAFQIVRSGIGSVALALVCASLCNSYLTHLVLSRKEYNLLLFTISSVGALGIANGFGLFKQNVAMMVESSLYSDERIFLAPHTFFNIMLPYFALTRRWAPAAACFVVVLLSGSRGALLATFATILVFGVHRSSNRFWFALSFAAASLILGSLLPTAFQRLYNGNLLDETVRLTEVSTAAAASLSWNTVLTGLPYSFPYWEGYEALGSFSFEAERVFLNSMFDVHNGFIFLLLRYGIVGSACLLILFKGIWDRHASMRPLLFCHVALWMTSAGPLVGIDGAFALALGAIIVHTDCQRAASSRRPEMYPRDIKSLELAANSPRDPF